MEIKTELLKLGTINNSIPLTRKLSASLVKPTEASELYINLDIDEILIRELKHGLHNEVIKEISSFSEDFLNVMNLTESDSINILFNYLRENNFDLIIVSSKICALAKDSCLFIFFGPSKLNNSFYQFGQLGNIDCYIDNFKKWDDNEIICMKKMNSFIYNYEFKKIDNNSSNTVFGGLDYNFVFNEESFLNLHFVDEYNPKYVQFIRDKKIDSII